MRGWLCFAMLVVAARPLAAQGLLPARFAGWQEVSASASAPAQPAADNAQLFRDCKQQSVEERTYQRGGQTIAVTLHQLGDPSYAYSAFSLLRPVAATDFRPTPHSSIGTDQAMLLAGNLLVDISGQNLPADAHDFSALAAALASKASSEEYPTLWQYLPTEQLIPHSDRYALNTGTFERALAEEGLGNWATGDWIGFQADEAEAEIARYKRGGKTVTLILLSYPTPQVAAAHLNDMTKWFDVNPTRNAAKGKPEPNASGAPGGGKTVLWGNRIGSLLGLVAGEPDEMAAQNLLGHIRYQTVVTWNEPGFKLHELTMPEYIVGSIFGTFILLGIALVVGIALGMIRVGVKHFFPGVVFDRHRSMEILQLGLSSKPIDGRDFY
jgi:Family of unknown function (DUF6599)